MDARALQPELDAILRGTSRSFYLTLKVVPRPVRVQLATAYLFCRAADTIAATRLLAPSERLENLACYRARFEADASAGDGESSDAFTSIAEGVGPPLDNPREEQLLRSLEICFDVYRDFEAGDRVLVRRLVTTLTEGMDIDLRHFPAEESGEIAALEDDKALDRYCYHVAGCVGEFWTDLSMDHLPALGRWDARRMRELGVRFGKGLQLTNILRDVDRDLNIGRCYLPRTRLESLGIGARELRAATDRSAVRPVVHDLLELTLDHYRAGWEYTLAIPRRLLTLRLACIWPLWIGLRTLGLLAATDDPCAAGVVRKIERPEVKGLMRRSVLRGLSNGALDREYRRLERRVTQRLGS